MITKITKKLAQQIVESVKDVCGQDINFINPSGIIFASTNPNRIGDYHEIGHKVTQTNSFIEVTENDSFSGTRQGVNLPVTHNGNIIATIGITGCPDDVRKYAYLAEKITKLLIREQELNQYNRAEEEKKSYIINTLIQELPIDHEYLRTTLEECSLTPDSKIRIIYMQMNVRYHISNLSMIEHDLHVLFRNTNVSLFSFYFPNAYIAVILEEDFIRYHSLYERFANTNQKLLGIGVGCISSIYQLSHSYQTALTARKSGTSANRNYTLYDELTLEIILSTITETVKDAYLKKTISQISDEDKKILKVYYEQNMSLTKTSELLYLHKNTIQYRLNHIYERTTFNPRNFKEAILLYLALYLEDSSFT